MWAAAHLSFNRPVPFHTFSPLVQVDKLLEEVAATKGPEGDTGGVQVPGAHALDARARLLERVAGEVSRLSFQANRGKVCGARFDTQVQSLGERHGHSQKFFFPADDASLCQLQLLSASCHATNVTALPDAWLVGAGVCADNDAAHSSGAWNAAGTGTCCLCCPCPHFALIAMSLISNPLSSHADRIRGSAGRRAGSWRLWSWPCIALHARVC